MALEKKLWLLIRLQALAHLSSWKQLNAYLRESIISYTTAQKKAAIKEQLDLQDTIGQLEVQFKSISTRT